MLAFKSDRDILKFVKPFIISIAGPTASGKSGLAISLAKMFDGEIVNADAIQVYRDLRVISARPTEREMQDIPHHLYGVIDGAQRYSAGRWARAAAPIIEEIIDRGKTAILVGGTGLYFRAIEEGLSPIPPVDKAVMEETQNLWDRCGPGEFYHKLIEIDGTMAHLNPADGQRLMRAWSVLRSSGKSLSVFQALPREPLLTRPVAAKLVLSPPRDILYQRCEMRFDQMMDEGAMEEARSLLALGLDSGLPVMKSLGAAELMAHLRGELALEEAIELAKRNTRRFAKRQMTWFRGQAGNWEWAQSAEEGLGRIEQILN